jgi:heat shock protein HspQ
MTQMPLSRDVDSLSTGRYDRVPVRNSGLPAMIRTTARFSIGDVVRHRIHPFRGVIFDVDPTFDNTEEWWLAIPEDKRPKKDQPFYHLLAENETSYYVAYVSEQNLVRDDSGDPVGHPGVEQMFGARDGARYKPDSQFH